MQLPSIAAVNDRRMARFREKISTALTAGDLTVFRDIIASYEQEHGVTALDIAAALAQLVQGDTPLLVADGGRREAPRDSHTASGERPERGKGPARASGHHKPSGGRPAGTLPPGTVRYRIAVGHAHGVKPGNIVGAIANEAGLDSRDIGRIDIHDDYSTIDLPEGMPLATLNHLKKVWVTGQQLQMRALDDRHGDIERRGKRAAAPDRTMKTGTGGRRAAPGHRHESVQGSRAAPGTGPRQKPPAKRGTKPPRR